MTSKPDRRQFREAKILASEKLNLRASTNAITIYQDRRQARRRPLFWLGQGVTLIRVGYLAA